MYELYHLIKGYSIHFVPEEHVYVPLCLKTRPFEFWGFSNEYYIEECCCSKTTLFNSIFNDDFIMI